MWASVLAAREWSFPVILCPTCHSPEAHPTRTDRVLIRAHKIESGGRWHSQCLVCSGYYAEDLTEQPDQHRRDAGWFSEE